MPGVYLSLCLSGASRLYLTSVVELAGGCAAAQDHARPGENDPEPL
jgi:hypothetical protein